MGQSRSKQAVKFFQQGNIFFGEKKYTRAISSYNEAIKIDPADVRFYLNKGNALNAVHQYRDAINCYNQVIDIDPLYYLAYYNKGNINFKFYNFKQISII